MNENLGFSLRSLCAGGHYGSQCSAFSFASSSGTGPIPGSGYRPTPARWHHVVVSDTARVRYEA